MSKNSIPSTMQLFGSTNGLYLHTMKNILTAFLLLATTTIIAQNVPQATFEKKGLKFDEIQEGSTLRVVWYFSNTGTAPLVIYSAKPTCGCTDVRYPKSAIAPGAKDSIVASFNSTGRPHYNAKGVNLTSNTGDISLVFEVMVKPIDALKPEKTAPHIDKHEGHNH